VVANEFLWGGSGGVMAYASSASFVNKSITAIYLLRRNGNGNLDWSWHGAIRHQYLRLRHHHDRV
jgi:hypothetical protein